MNNYFYYLLLLLSVNQLQAQQGSANAAIRLLNSKNIINKNNWSFYASIDNEEFCNYNGDKLLKPASIQKLITTGTALIIIDSTFRYETCLEHSGKIINDTLFGNIYIHGSGDPSFGSERFDSTSIDFIFKKYLRAIQSYHIKTITGSIIADVSMFDSTLFTTKMWKPDDYGNYYGAGSCGLNFHENYYTVFFNSGKTIGDNTAVSYIYPDIPNITILNKVITAKIQTGDNVIIYGEPYNLNRTFTGTIPVNATKFAVKGSMPDPAYTCAWHLNKYFKEKGIVVLSEPKRIFKPEIERAIICTHLSPALKDIIKVTNEQSNNTYAESILKTIAYNKTGIGTTKEGLDFINSQFLKFAHSHIHLFDGSGLSDSNRISAKTMVDFLIGMQTQQQFNCFYNSLPIAGRSGSLKNIFLHSPLENNVRAKSGSMKKIRCYAGYMQNSKKQKVIFCLMMNDFSIAQSKLLKEIELLLLSLY